MQHLPDFSLIFHQHLQSKFCNATRANSLWQQPPWSRPRAEPDYSYLGGSPGGADSPGKAHTLQLQALMVCQLHSAPLWHAMATLPHCSSNGKRWETTKHSPGNCSYLQEQLSGYSYAALKQLKTSLLLLSLNFYHHFTRNNLHLKGKRSPYIFLKTVVMYISQSLGTYCWNHDFKYLQTKLISQPSRESI